MFTPVTVERDGVVFTCEESEEQLQLFLNAGYKVLELKKTAPATSTKKKKTTSE